ncbi:glycoside hydrolase family 3 N-terminal domain-containing protein [Agathobaculum sp.]|uniref:glycoside hydrolase family 3 N-terminal domain-containing protein n=1 Tax=Agathobaculum sp. TaxID=2048138 RepID=UPI002A7F73E2|nr:glycoside hydrolase family 3 N-terminal domain-containing protein [Agathobaculum sp.]MDY3619388.1 glycoside hydrolase family 3 N-terminal domain-containing protein [Agathobaculum sp.]
MKKRIVCLLFACLLTASACGKQPAALPDAPSDSAPQTAPEEPPAEPTPDPAETYVDDLTLEEQIAQMFFARCPETDAAALAGQYNIGGYILFGRDFEGQTPDSVRETIASYQAAAKTPMLIGVDEEGGTVVRVSSNPNFRAAKFHSPQSLYAEGGMELVVSDTKEKDELLSSIGVNVNLAPVCDVSTDAGDFIFDRSFGQDAASTSEYVRAVVIQMSEDNMGAVLKHFPGYGNNIDTHTGIAVDDRPLETFRENDFKPFQAGFGAGAGSVLVCHNIMTAVDPDLPASLSPAVHELLRGELGYQGVVMTDDLIMDAITEYTDGADAAVLAVQAGNDMLISSDFVTQYQAVLDAVYSGSLSKEQIRESAVRVVRWKMVLGLL